MRSKLAQNSNPNINRFNGGNVLQSKNIKTILYKAKGNCLIAASDKSKEYGEELLGEVSDLFLHLHELHAFMHLFCCLD
jgi:hypothetical protein